MSGLLTHQPSDVIRWALIQLGQGVDPLNGTGPGGSINPLVDWPIYAYLQPSAFDNVLSIFDVEGQIDGMTQPDREQNEHYGIQVLVRARSDALGAQKARAVANAFEKLFQLPVTVPAIGPPDSIPAHTYEVNNVVRKSVLSLGHGPSGDKMARFSINCITPIRQLS